MSDNLFETPFSFWIWAIVYDILAGLLFWLPRTLRQQIVKPLRHVLEEAIILAYLTDGSDIGFLRVYSWSRQNKRNGR